MASASIGQVKQPAVVNLPTHLQMQRIAVSAIALARGMPFARVENVKTSALELVRSTSIGIPRIAAAVTTLAAAAWSVSKAHANPNRALAKHVPLTILGSGFVPMALNFIVITIILQINPHASAVVNMATRENIAGMKDVSVSAMASLVNPR